MEWEKPVLGQMEWEKPVLGQMEWEKPVLGQMEWNGWTMEMNGWTMEMNAQVKAGLDDQITFGSCSHDLCVCSDKGDPDHYATDCPVKKCLSFHQDQYWKPIDLPIILLISWPPTPHPSLPEVSKKTEDDTCANDSTSRKAVTFWAPARDYKYDTSRDNSSRSCRDPVVLSLAFIYRSRNCLMCMLCNGVINDDEIAVVAFKARFIVTDHVHDVHQTC
ncbi:hypothetical protein AVEN_233661-1 [Araneus ventricosus]|uniref:Uncharacterized protein n=1 Tax=Araneus ventricosus TaxID=182803 RepID=A0A4Y2GMI5_ARAVE|nr:hypothetical protein AVEN_233661-1 [Araneus ventricosus]